MLHDVIIIGSGPAALMAASQLSEAALKVALFEKRASPGWKLLVAGSSGLNVSFEAQDLAPYYPKRQKEIAHCLEKFPKSEWLSFLKGMDEDPFLGTSGRYFIKNKKASQLLKNWVEHLETKNITFHYNEEFAGFENGRVKFKSGREEQTKFLLLALGGASWENSTPEWPQIFTQKGIHCEPFAPSNAGYHIKAPKEFFLEAEGKPIKGLKLKTALGEKLGELMITKYGLEGTPVYTLGCPGIAYLDLKPDLAEEKLWVKIKNAHGNVEKKLEQGAKLSPGAIQLVKHLAPNTEISPALASLLKNFPVELLEPRSLTESISSKGGLSWDELNEELELKKAPNVFCVGEMVDWDAPTGGFLIQACVSMGFTAALAIKKRTRT